VVFELFVASVFFVVSNGQLNQDSNEIRISRRKLERIELGTRDPLHLLTEQRPGLASQ